MRRMIAATVVSLGLLPALALATETTERRGAVRRPPTTIRHVPNLVPHDADAAEETRRALDSFWMLKKGITSPDNPVIRQRTREIAPSRVRAPATEVRSLTNPLLERFWLLKKGEAQREPGSPRTAPGIPRSVPPATKRGDANERQRDALHELWLKKKNGSLDVSTFRRRRD